MTRLTALAAVLILGCVNEYPTAVSEPLRQTTVMSEETTPVTPQDDASPYTAGVDLNEESELLNPPDIYFPSCVCEYVGWHEHGLICLGIKCTLECSAEVVACNEQRRSCVPDM